MAKVKFEVEKGFGQAQSIVAPALCLLRPSQVQGLGPLSAGHLPAPLVPWSAFPRPSASADGRFSFSKQIDIV